MLSLFQQEAPLRTHDEIIQDARQLMMSFLNKGKVPTWEEFRESLLHDEFMDAVEEFYHKMINWSFLDQIIADDINEYFFHGPDNSQQLLSNGEKREIKIPLSLQDWQLWLEVLSISYQQNWNVQNPFASFHGELRGKNFRLSLIHSSTSPHGISKLVIRHLSSQNRPLADYGGNSDLKSMIMQKKNILIAGSTGSGKTSLLTSLINQIPDEEHVVILEDTYEIMSKHSHQTRFLASNSNESSLKDFLSYSLRLSPDRMILGEMRSHEVIPFLMAMNTGHKGLMGTIHASSAQDAIGRMALLFTLYAPETQLNLDKVIDLICKNVEIIIFMENKKIKEIIKIFGSENGVAFYDYLEGHREINLS
jgi:type IV secretion system protein VirB11